jgi:hypothetical protein
MCDGVTADRPSTDGQCGPLRLQQMSLVVRNDETQGIPQTEMKERNKMKGDPDPSKILGIRMTKDIVQRVALALEAFNDYLPLFQVFSRADGFHRFHFQDTAVGPGHYFFIGPLPQPAAAVLVGRAIGSQGDAGKDVADVDVVGQMEVSEYLNDTPLPRGGWAGQLLFRQTKKGIRACFDQLGTVQ